MGISDYWKKLENIVLKHPKGKPLSKEGFWPDPTPVAPPVGNSMVAEIDMFERHRQMIRGELSRMAEEAGFETMEEADDFDIADDIPEPFSPWEQIAGFKLDDVPSDLDPVPNPPPLKPEGDGAEPVGGSGGPPNSPPAKPAPAGS